MTMPWQLHQDLIRANEALLARSAQNAVNVAGERHDRARRGSRLLAALRAVLARRATTIAPAVAAAPGTKP
jgi:hypothetical protein